MSEKFEGDRPSGSPEKPEEKEETEVRPEIKTPRAEEKYTKTTKFFESYLRDFSEQLKQAETAKDEEAIRGIKKARKECNDIIESLKTGDVNPAIKKISEMIEQNFKILKGGIPDAINPAERIEIVKELIDYLAELKGFEGEPRKLHEIKELVNDSERLENILGSKKEEETMAKYERLGAVEFINELTTEELDKFVAVRPDGSKNLTTSPVYDERGTFTGRYKVYEKKPEIIRQKKNEIEEIAKEVERDYERKYVDIENYRLEIMEQQVKQGNAEDLGEVTLAELYSQHPDFKSSKDVLIRLYDESGRRIEGKFRAFKWRVSASEEKT